MTSVLLVRLSAMGDLVQSLGAVASLHAARPDWRLTFVTQREWAPLLDGMPGVARLVCFDRRGGLRAVRAVRRELRRERFDAALDLQGNWKSALLTRLSGAPRRVGMAAGWRQEPWSRVLLTRTLTVAARPHPARAAWELARHLAPEAPFVRPPLVATADELAHERAALAAAGIDAAAPFRVVVRTDPADPRALSRELLDGLSDGAPCLHLLGPAEAGLAAPEGPTLRHERGQVRRLVALGALVRAAGGEVVGPDQGATHVLLAAGAPGRVFFGSQDPARTSPPSARALIGPGPLPCRPCRSARCRHPEGPVCMRFAPDQAVEVRLSLPGSS